LTFGEFLLASKKKRDNKDRNNLGRFHDSLDWERNISQGLTSKENGDKTEGGDFDFGFQVHTTLGSFVIESINKSGNDEREQILEQRGSKSKSELLISSFFTIKA